VLDLMEAVVVGTAGGHEGDEERCGTADEVLGVVVGRNGEELEPLVDVVKVLVGAV
jgi:hypothetical protein